MMMAGSKHSQKPNPINCIPVTVLVFRLAVIEGKSIAREVPLSRASIAAAARAFDTECRGTRTIPVTGESLSPIHDTKSGPAPLS